MLFEKRRNLSKISQQDWFLIFEKWHRFNLRHAVHTIHPTGMQDLVDRLDYELMDAEFISDVVEPSGLMSKSKLSKAYKFHAVQSAKKLKTGLFDSAETRWSTE